MLLYLPRAKSRFTSVEYVRYVKFHNIIRFGLIFESTEVTNTTGEIGPA